MQNGKDYERAQAAYERAATGHQRQGSPWQSGKALERAADMAKQGERSGEGVVEALYRDAARAYLEAGRTQAAAEALARAAQHLEGLDPKVAAARRSATVMSLVRMSWTTWRFFAAIKQASSQLYLDAVDALEEDGKEGTAGDLYRHAIGACLDPCCSMPPDLCELW